MAANLRVAAAALRRIGAKNSPGGQDTDLVYVNESEKAQLAANGGSGRRDPQTGILHFAQVNEGDDGSDNTDSGGNTDAEGNLNGNSMGGGDNDTADGGIINADGDPSYNGPRATGTDGSLANGQNLDGSTPNAGTSRPDGGLSTNYSSNLTPEEAADLSSGKPQTVYGIDGDGWSTKGSKWGKAIGSILLGPAGMLAGGLIGGLAGPSNNTVNGGGWGTGSESTGHPGPSNTAGPNDKGNNSSATTAANSITDIAGVNLWSKGSSAVTPVAPAFDLFSGLPRDKYGSQDQVLAGLGSVAGTVVKKPGAGA